MVFSLTTVFDDTRATITLEGELDADSAKRFRREIDRVREARAACLELNLANLSFMASAGLGALIDAQRRFGLTCPLTVVDAQGAVLETLKKTGFAGRLRLVSTRNRS